MMETGVRWHLQRVGARTGRVNALQSSCEPKQKISHKNSLFSRVLSVYFSACKKTDEKVALTSSKWVKELFSHSVYSEDLFSAQRTFSSLTS
ncbi:hypothetical protein NPIL_162041 [Nephila pilipes]|uniref:Uncharacterized protein n=1 Tax=Nephila pilipes TaxID=299642 RepID=A0A8X6U1R9_NEPPI|nr:hypothetical protein NPIL_162041 [Nephila pilipes]